MRKRLYIYREAITAQGRFEPSKQDRSNVGSRRLSGSPLARLCASGFAPKSDASPTAFRID
jgi:hypothetical protein